MTNETDLTPLSLAHSALFYVRNEKHEEKNEGRGEGCVIAVVVGVLDSVRSNERHSEEVDAGKQMKRTDVATQAAVALRRTMPSNRSKHCYYLCNRINWRHTLTYSVVTHCDLHNN